MFDELIAAAVHVEAMFEMSAIFHVGFPDVLSESHTPAERNIERNFLDTGILGS
jgi:hypothetical protein